MKKKILYIEFLPILIIGLILFKLLDRIDSLFIVLKFILKILQPIFWAIAISYVLNPLVKLFEKKFRIKRVFSILLSYIIVIGLIIMIITIIIPMIAENVSDLIENYDYYKNVITDYFNNVIMQSKFYKELSLEKYLNSELIASYFTDVPSILTNTLDGIVKFIFSIFGALFKIIVGFIIAVYLLFDKEKFQLGFRRILYSLLNKKPADKSIMFLKDVNYIFSRYIIGKTLDSAIIGMLCFIGLLILNVPYAALLSIIVGVTNMIPYFGPFIGMIPAIFLTIFFSPIKAIWVGLFILGLQQFDGYVLGPKILGDSVGLSPFWIIFGILIGGSLMGVLGMLLAVPIMAVLQLIAVKIIDKSLLKKGIKIE